MGVKDDQEAKKSMLKETSANLAEPETFEEFDEYEVVISKSPTIAVAEIFEDNETNKTRYKRRSSIAVKAISCGKKVLFFMLSYVGLTCTVVGYSILGGVIFMALESPHESEIRTSVAALRQQHINELHQLNIQHNTFRQENWTTGADDILRKFQMEVYAMIKKEGWDGEDAETTGDSKWSFAGSLLFSVTVITTIGYGFITPKTDAGRVITMLYAVVGIPLTFLCLTNIGKFLAGCFRALYGRTFCISCRRRFFRFITLKYRRPEASMDRIELKSSEDNLKNCSSSSFIHSHEMKYKANSVCAKHKEVEVPLFVCLVLVAWYIVFGAILFTIWETEWDLLTGSYFCFITLSTIGFGDVIPGYKSEDWNDQVKQVVCTMYLLFGLSLLAMCFDLAQQQGRDFAKRICIKIGLVSRYDHAHV